MDEDNTLNFCTACGANIHSYDEFCPSCGQSIKGEVAPARNENYAQGKSSKLLIVGILGMLWAVFALFIGVFMLFATDAVVTEMVNDSIYDAYGFTAEDWRSLCIITGGMLVLSGIFALISSICCFTKRYFILAFIACIVGSIFSLILFVGFIGLVCVYLIYSSRRNFKN